jgi:hypothetical protein
MIDLVISQEEQILSALAKVPDEEWLNPDLTEDQRKYWYQLKEGYTKLELELNAYFNGQQTTLTNTKKDRGIGVLADYYISLYSLIQVGFSAIKKIFQEVFCPPELAEIKELESPGTLFKALIWCESLFAFNCCTKGYFTWTPSGALKERKLMNTLRDKSIPKHKRIQAQRKLKPKIAEVKNDFYFHLPRSLVIEACQKEAQTNQRLKNKLDDFNRCFERIEQTSSKNLRKKAKGFGFSKGQRIYPLPYGGIWKTFEELSQLNISSYQ